MYLWRTTSPQWAGKEAIEAWRQGRKNVPPKERSLWISFQRLGRGIRNQSDFALEINWGDVEKLIKVFAETGHRSALRLQKARKPVKSIQRL